MERQNVRKIKIWEKSSRNVTKEQGSLLAIGTSGETAQVDKFSSGFSRRAHKKLNGQKIHSFLNQILRDASRRNNATQRPSTDHRIVTMPFPFEQNQPPIHQSATPDPSSPAYYNMLLFTRYD
jgi:hypothetical protein